MIPVRCFTCGKPISTAWEEFRQRREKGEDPKQILTDLNISRYCCRRMLLTHKVIIDELNPYQQIDFMNEGSQGSLDHPIAFGTQ